MKKMLDGKFLFILGISVLMLIAIIAGTFYLFNNSDSTFVKSGYVLNPLNAKVEKYFFEKDTSYHENLSSMIEFKDIDNNQVMVVKDSFLHYEDGSLSLLKNGAILDLNSINGKRAVAFYNITSKSIIESSNDGYVIKTNTNNIKLKNFIARINDNKYIIVGNLEAKIPGNNANIKSEYFEIVYTENGIINIENRDLKYQVTAEGTYIYVNGLVIDLGSKAISQNGEDIMSLTAITINGNENIEIIPKNQDKDDTGNQGGIGEGDNTGENGGNQQDNKEKPVEVIKEKSLTVNISEAEVKSTNVKVKFEMENVTEEDSFTLRVTNLESGVTVDKFNIVEGETYNVSLLSPNTKYLFTVINNKDDQKYFQRIFETEDFGIELSRSYATDNELGYKITVGTGTEIQNATLSLYKFNEEKGYLEPVTEIVKENDVNGNIEQREEQRIITLSDLGGNIEGEHEVFFDNLDSNTIYTVKLSDFSVITQNFKDLYDITLTDITLKKTPDFNKSEPTWTKDESSSNFKLSVSNIEDPDNAILTYTYGVYEVDKSGNVSKELARPQIVKSDATPIVIPVGGEDGLKVGQKYTYRLKIEYFDNEKYLEYVTTYSDGFRMDEDPLVTIVPDSEETQYNRTSYNRIGATIYLTDNSCLIQMPGRSECDGISNVDIYIIDNAIAMGNTLDNNAGVQDIIKGVTFELVDGKLQYSLDVSDLEEDTYYRIKVVNNDTPNGQPVEIQPATDIKGIKTKKISTFDILWTDSESNSEDVINTFSKFVANDNGELSKEESARSIKRIDVTLYKGNYPNGINSNEIEPISPVKTFLNTTDFNLKTEFYEKEHLISNNIFDLDLDDLKTILGDNPENNYYFTLNIKAYYDENGNNPIKLGSSATHPYLVNRALFEADLGEFVITDPKNIKREDNIYYQDLTSPNTVIGYEFETSFEEQKLLAAHYDPKGVRISVYDMDNNPVDFYVIENNNLVQKQSIYRMISAENFNDSYEIYVEPDPSSDKNTMRRGVDYYIGFEVDVGVNGFLPVNTSGIPKNYGTYKKVTSIKENPDLTMYIRKTTENSVTYSYTIKDTDYALYEDNNTYNLYYEVSGAEHALPIELTDEENNTYSGSITIPNLTQGSYYAIYMKLNLTGNEIKKYPNVSNTTKRLFEGTYTIDESNFKFQVLTSGSAENQVRIKMLADNELLNRILLYKVKFSTDNGENTWEPEYWQLESCGAEDTDAKCINVDYDELRTHNMKSSPDETKIITVDIEVAYDTGLAGYDYINQPINDKQYMIMQDNNVEDEIGSYLAFNKQNTIVIWNNTYDIAKGYYKISYKSLENNELYYTKVMSPKNVQKTVPTYSETIDGRMVSINNKDIIINPKVVLVTDLNYNENQTFSFNSYTPTIKVTTSARLINGIVANLKLTGADITEFCEESEGNTCVNHGTSGTYKLYTEVYKKSDAEKVKTYSFEILNNENPNAEAITARMDGLYDSTAYYFKVYAWLNKDTQKEYTQLFDADLSINEFKNKDYDFTTKSGADLAGEIRVESVIKSSVSELSANANYGERVLKTTIGLVKYDNSIPFNYNIEYILCEQNVTEEICNQSTMRNTISANTLKSSNVDYIDVSSDLDYSKNYILYIYAIYKDFNNNDVKIPIMSKKDDFKDIKRPTFNVERKKAFYENGESYIDIKVNVNDPDERLINGKYSVGLFLDNTSAGDIYVSHDDGLTYKPVPNDYEFDARDTNLKIQVRNLASQTKKYEIIVTGEAYLDNHNETVTIKLDKPILIYSANESGVALGETANFKGANNIVVITLPGGSNADKIVEVSYTIGYWANYNEAVADFKDHNLTISGNYVLSESNNKFTYNKSADLQYTINLANENQAIELVNGTTLAAVVVFKVETINPITSEKEYSNIRFANSFEYGKIEE